MNHLAIWIELDDFGTADAAVDPRRVAVAADLVPFRSGSAIQEPDVVLVIDVDTGDLLHAPPVRQRLRPERIDFEDGRAVLVQHLRTRLLSAAGCPRQGTHNENGHEQLLRHGDPPTTARHNDHYGPADGPVTIPRSVVGLASLIARRKARSETYLSSRITRAPISIGNFGPAKCIGCHDNARVEPLDGPLTEPLLVGPSDAKGQRNQIGEPNERVVAQEILERHRIARNSSSRAASMSWKNGDHSLSEWKRS